MSLRHTRGSVFPTNLVLKPEHIQLLTVPDVACVEDMTSDAYALYEEITYDQDMDDPVEHVLGLVPHRNGDGTFSLTWGARGVCIVDMRFLQDVLRTWKGGPSHIEMHGAYFEDKITHNSCGGEAVLITHADIIRHSTRAWLFNAKSEAGVMGAFACCGAPTDMGHMDGCPYNQERTT